MPVLSYLAYPANGRKSDLVATLGDIPECEVIESDNDDLLILVTSASDDDAERALEKRLDAIDSLSMLTLVFGHRSADMSPPATVGGSSKENHA